MCVLIVDCDTFVFNVEDFLCAHISEFSRFSNAKRKWSGLTVALKKSIFLLINGEIQFHIKHNQRKEFTFHTLQRHSFFVTYFKFRTCT